MIAFAHHHHQNLTYGIKGTLALEVPTKQDLEMLFNEHATCTLMNVGVAKLYHKDVHVKKIGREESIKKMKLTKVTFIRVEIRGTKHVYEFTGRTENDVDFTFGLSTIKESDKVKFVFSILMAYE